MSRLTIFQPCYFAPLYLFQRIVDSDVWVSLLSAQYTRRTPQGVATIAPLRGARMRLRVPCQRGFPPIETTKIDGDQWKRKHLGSLRHAYAAAPHVDFMLELAGSVLAQPADTLGDLVMASMLAPLELMRQDGVWTGTIVRDSAVIPNGSALRASAWMLSLAQALEAREYLCGEVGLRQYLDVTSFERCGIAVRAQQWKAPAYAKGATNGVGSLSILDLLAWRGRGFSAYFTE
ncbi:MAG: WbqC family protein [Candidatus Binatia bacterium]